MKKLRGTIKPLQSDKQLGAVIPESVLAFVLILVVMTLAALFLFGAFQRREENVRETFSGSDLCLKCESNCDPELCPE